MRFISKTKIMRRNDKSDVVYSKHDTSTLLKSLVRGVRFQEHKYDLTLDSRERDIACLVALQSAIEKCGYNQSIAIMLGSDLDSFAHIIGCDLPTPIEMKYRSDFDKRKDDVVILKALDKTIRKLTGEESEDSEREEDQGDDNSAPLEDDSGRWIEDDNMDIVSSLFGNRNKVDDPSDLTGLARLGYDVQVYAASTLDKIENRIIGYLETYDKSKKLNPEALDMLWTNLPKFSDVIIIINKLDDVSAIITKFIKTPNKTNANSLESAINGLMLDRRPKSNMYYLKSEVPILPSARTGHGEPRTAKSQGWDDPTDVLRAAISVFKRIKHITKIGKIGALAVKNYDGKTVEIENKHDYLILSTGIRAYCRAMSSSISKLSSIVNKLVN